MTACERNADLLATISLQSCSGVFADSRKVTSGGIFVAMKGANTDGHQYIQDALLQGAHLIICDVDYLGTAAYQGWKAVAQAQARDHGNRPPHPAEIVPVRDTRAVYAGLAMRLWPEMPETIAAITGSNGKSSVAWMTAQLAAAFGQKSASLGTLGCTVWPEKKTAERETALEIGLESLTTPDAFDLHKCLNGLTEQGVSFAALEASSHGLDQRRLDSVRLSVAAFTNLSRDHLDYHSTMQAYWSAKARLFSELLSAQGTAVINRESKYGRSLCALVEDSGQRCLTVGRGEDVMIRLVSVAAKSCPLALRLDIEIEATCLSVDLNLCGLFQAENLLIALGIIHAAGELPRRPSGDLDCQAIRSAIAEIAPVPGRMQPVAQTAKGGMVLVDFAHTPDGLRRCCEAARAHVAKGGRLGLVFGAGGDRDRGKRAEMGRVARLASDFAILTDDNPRTEEPAEIAREIWQGYIGDDDTSEATQGNRKTQGDENQHAGQILHDRRQAIAAGVRDLQEGDVLVIAGKGHERTQTLGTTHYPFHDPTVAREEVLSQGGHVL